MRSRYRTQIFEDPEERALQRLLFLRKQVVTQFMLEDLVESVEKGSFEEETMDGQLSAYVDQIVDEYAPSPQAFSLQLLDALVFTMYDSIQFYKDVPFRKIGGRYFRHPALLFNILVAAGCNDFETLPSSIGQISSKTTFLSVSFFIPAARFIARILAPAFLPHVAFQNFHAV